MKFYAKILSLVLSPSLLPVGYQNEFDEFGDRKDAGREPGETASFTATLIPFGAMAQKDARWKSRQELIAKV